MSWRYAAKPSLARLRHEAGAPWSWEPEPPFGRVEAVCGSRRAALWWSAPGPLPLSTCCPCRVLVRRLVRALLGELDPHRLDTGYLLQLRRLLSRRRSSLCALLLLVLVSRSAAAEVRKAGETKTSATHPVPQTTAATAPSTALTALRIAVVAVPVVDDDALALVFLVPPLPDAGRRNTAVAAPTSLTHCFRPSDVLRT